jgi:hypothetical protein
LWAAVLGGFATIFSAAVLVWPPKASGLGRGEDQPTPRPRIPGWARDRPAEVSAMVKALASQPSRLSGFSMLLYGAGGAGKTTLTLLVRDDRRIRRRFKRVYVVQVGRSAHDAAAIAAKVNEVVGLVGGVPRHAAPELAGQ